LSTKNNNAVIENTWEYTNKNKKEFKLTRIFLELKISGPAINF